MDVEVRRESPPATHAAGDLVLLTFAGRAEVGLNIGYEPILERGY
jgi:hypothetical protein